MYMSVYLNFNTCIILDILTILNSSIIVAKFGLKFLLS